MTIRTKIILGLFIVIHSILSMYSFVVLFAIGHMHSDDTPHLLKFVFQFIFLITWLPLLHLISFFKQTLLSSYAAWITLSLINSFISVAIGYSLVKKIRINRA